MLQPSIRMGFVDIDTIHKADLAVTRFFSDCCIPFNCANSFYYQPMVDAASPMVSQLAIQILSQTTSYGHERNSSVFERIHTTKRNKLEDKRLNDLVYVHYNLGLKSRMVNKRITLDHADYESMENIEFWITGELEEAPSVNHDEIEKILYYLTNPIHNLAKDDEDLF
ncbi:hypothetical protein Lal_00044757 [Lupinus albus]|nr:hypothetical protein Lal_00044757 [Lupinus albus]